ncbi:MAG: adenine phosphoribosyltransferase [Bacteriovoracaceae bacterium]|nr:adenine phosphoribosyltransferase [Bacteriovoracaceae bacterium]
MTEEKLKALIREIADFPKKGILFKDITPLLENGAAFQSCIVLLADRIKALKPTKLVGIESRGFIFAAALSHYLKLGLVLARKTGKLPSKTFKQTYQLEYGTDEIEIHVDSLSKKDSVVIIDDVLATGGTALGAVSLCNQSGAKVLGILSLIELEFLNGRKVLASVPVYSLFKY